MILPHLFIKSKIISTIVAPHGITDLIHSIQTNNTKTLLSINSCCISTSLISSIQPNIDFGFNIFFLIGSVFHFRHDYPKTTSQILEFFLSFMTILSFIKCPNLFYFYMSLLHVPKHYLSNWIYTLLIK